MTHPNDSRPDDLQDVIAQLRAHRPEATPLELDAVKRRVRARAARPAGSRARSAAFMKSRLAILLMLVFGVTLSTAGAGMAVSNIGGNDASVAEYGSGDTPGGETPGGDTGGDVLGEEDTGNGGDTAGEEAGNGLQPSRQVEAGANGGDQLPFTGFLAIPILIGGVALLATGLVLRRRVADDHS
jgi:hypothetical protein